MGFPASERTNSYGALSIPTATEPSFIRRLSGVYPISTFLDSNNPLAWTDVKVSLDTYIYITGLNNYYTKTEIDNA